MSLRSKIVLILLVVVGLYAAIDNGILRVFASRAFESWELEEARENLERASAAIEEEIGDLEGKGRIWAAVEGLRQVVADPACDAAALGLGPAALESSRVDLFFVCDREGNVAWSRIRDPETGEAARLRELPSQALHASHPLRNFRQGEDVVSGLMMTQRGPLLVSAHPVPDHEGRRFPPDDGTRFRHPLFGQVILGRFLDAQLAKRIEDTSRAEISIEPVDAGSADGEAAELLGRLTAGSEDFVSTVDDQDRLHVVSVLSDLRTGQHLLLRAVSEREIFARGRTAVRYALLSTLAAAFLILLVLLRLLQRSVVRPLGKLTAKAVEIGRTDDTTIRVGLEREDEIGQLSREFDRMLEKLARSRQEVVRTARLAGMSEIATGVLHNVGNVLNSVNVSASLLRQRAQALSVADLEKVVGVLREHADDLAGFWRDDPRGRHFLPFLEELTASLAAQRRELDQELAQLSEGIDHISDLVRSQQSYAGTKGVFELASLSEEVESAVKMTAQALGGLRDVEIVREYEELPPVPVDKHKLMEILVNLVQNARQAMSETPERRLVLRVQRVDPATARIEVEDSGVGIPAENLEKVFAHGFTTRPDGHGFGLHVSANAATELGGALRVRSQGPGRGATFYLDLPMAREAARAA